MRNSLLYGLTGALSITSLARAGPIPVSVVPDCKPPPGHGTNYNISYLPIFFDDFKGLPGSQPTTNWLFDTGTSYPGGASFWGNFEKEIYTTNTENIHITADETLLITPILNSTGNWTSARIETRRSDFACPEGKKLFIQSKIKLGADPITQQQGIWPAFWSLGSKFRGNFTNWPLASEWDIMESTNGLPRNTMTIHCGIAPNGPCKEYDGISNMTFMKRGIFNTYGFEVDRTPSSWEQESLSWYLNGEKKFQVLAKTVGDFDAWANLAHEEHFLLLNVAVGGTVPDVYKLNATTPTKDTKGGMGAAMEVEYVGVWVS